jgi:hypothetical protein
MKKIKIIGIGLMIAACATTSAFAQLRTQQLLIDDNATSLTTRNTITLKAPADSLLTSNYNIILPTTAGSANQLLMVSNVNGSNATSTWSSSLTGMTITGGSINNTPIGATTPSTGNFTNLNTSGTVTLDTSGTGTVTIGNNSGPSNTILNGKVTFGDTVIYATPPTIPLANHNIWKGNASNTQTAYAPGAEGTMLVITGGDPQWSTAAGLSQASNGSGAGATTTNIGTNTPSTGHDTINIGSTSSTTNIAGNVVYGTAPTIPLPKDNIWVGNASNVQLAVAPGTAGQVLQIVGTTPTWTTPTATTFKGIVTAGPSTTQTVNDSRVTGTSSIVVTYEDTSGGGQVDVYVSGRVAGTSFTVMYSALPNSGSQLNYTIIN